MRRSITYALAALTVLFGCGTERPTAVRVADASVSPTSSPSVATSTTPTPSPEDGDPLARFPLAVGYDTENGDDHSPVVVTDRPASKGFSLCGKPVWDPRAGTVDVIGVEWRGEAEWSRGRTLALYPDDQTATDAVTAARAAIASCPVEPGEPGYGTAHTLLDRGMGDQSVRWTDTYWIESGADRLFDTGLTVYDLIRVGRAVLLTYEYGEGNGSDQSRLAAVARAEKADRPVVERMADVSGPRPGAAPSITPAGVGPFELGMSAGELREAAPDVDIREHTSCGATLSWTGPEGVEVSGGINTRDGLAYVSARGAGAATAEGIAVGDTLADLYRVYPTLEAYGTGGSDSFMSDQGEAAYVFTLDGTRDLPSASDRHVVQIMVIADDQHCAS